MPSLVGTAGSQVGWLVDWFDSFLPCLMISEGYYSSESLISLWLCVTVRVSTTSSTKYSGTGRRWRPLSEPGEDWAMGLSECYNLSLSLPCLGNWNFYWPCLHCCIYSHFQTWLFWRLPSLPSLCSAECWCQSASSFWCRCVNVLLTNPIWVVVMRMQVSQCALCLFFISTICI
jgi:hypothetical protein